MLTNEVRMDCDSKCGWFVRVEAPDLPTAKSRLRDRGCMFVMGRSFCPACTAKALLNERLERKVREAERKFKQQPGSALVQESHALEGRDSDVPGDIP